MLLFFKDSLLLCVCSVIEHGRCQKVVRMSVTNEPLAECVTDFHTMFLWGPLLNRSTVTLNLLVVRDKETAKRECQ